MHACAHSCSWAKAEAIIAAGFALPAFGTCVRNECFVQIRKAAMAVAPGTAYCMMWVGEFLSFMLLLNCFAACERDWHSGVLVGEHSAPAAMFAAAL